MRRLLVCCAIMLSLPAAVLAAHPLITDDAGTVGKGKHQLELNTEYGHDREQGITARVTEFSTAFTYGILDNLDLVVGGPYSFVRVKDAGSKFSDDGIGDVSVELKWRFFEQDGWSVAVKPVMTLPTGDEDRGFGTGRMTGSLFLIGTREIEPWAFHLNLGYIRNENRIGGRKDIWHLSVASELLVAKGLKVVANIGVERNPGRASDTHPAFILAGVIYSISGQVDIDLGVKGGLTRPETDLAFLGGVTLKF